MHGRLRVPGDKSISHRALLLAARAEGTSVVRGLSDGDDVLRTHAAVVALGADIDGDRITGGAHRLHECETPIDCGNSGTGIRLLMGFCAAFPFLTVLTGDESVRRRPMDRVAQPLRMMGAFVDGEHAPLSVHGGDLHGIDYTVPVPSAQVKSAVLLAGLGASGETVVREPVPTRAHTEEMLKRCGADIQVESGGAIRLRPSSLQAFEYDVPGDPSQAAFWVVAATIVPGSDLVIENVYTGQARAGFLAVLLRMGADIEGAPNGDIRVRHAALHATEVGGAEVPGLIDEVPVLAVAAACAEGATVFRDAAELRVKESDRIATVVSMLTALGAKAEPTDDGLVVTGPSSLHGATVDSHGDHRIAMSATIAGLVADGPVTVEGFDSVATSYPGFTEDLRRCVS